MASIHYELMNLNDLRFRNATPADIETLSDIARRAKAVWGYPAAWMEAWRDQLTIQARELEQDDIRVATLADAIVGFVSVGRVDEASKTEGRSVGEICHMWIDPENQRGGLGRAVFDEALCICRDRGYELLRIDSDPNAIGFYMKMGCRVIGTVSADVLGLPRSLPLLELDLTLTPRRD